jgi:hypothetical protein
LFIAKGNGEAMPDFADNDPDDLLIKRPNGLFFEAGLAADLAQKNQRAWRCDF